MKKTLLLLNVLFLLSMYSEAGQSKWWLNKPYRLYQSNLRDIYVDFDINVHKQLVK